MVLLPTGVKIKLLIPMGGYGGKGEIGGKIGGVPDELECAMWI